ncbi:MAG TPA: isopenicillin N synthase family oxygenase [Gammaproteobacteria bacterium]|nr:isopenicillin N synthase family oxygenase [Gammaproteobacteria bacterium]
MNGILPTISLSKLADKDAQEIEKLYNVCSGEGFLYLTDHGVPLPIISNAIKASRHFFELPENVKRQYGQEHQTVFPNTSRGYSPLGGETLYGKAGPDPKELFDLGFNKPPSDQPFTGPNLMPDDSVAPNFASSLYELQHEIMSKVSPILLRGFALALKLEENWFDKYFDDPILIQRVIYYPENGGKAGKHTDNGIFTVLIQEPLPSPSLRVFTKDSWIDAPCPEGVFVINLGDMLQLWTNGLFVSTPHEVMHNLPVTRISLPFFVYPNIDTILEPFGTDQKISTREVMLKNFDSIWVSKKGGGMRVDELK